MQICIDVNVFLHPDVTVHLFLCLQMPPLHVSFFLFVFLFIFFFNFPTWLLSGTEVSVPWQIPAL